MIVDPEGDQLELRGYNNLLDLKGELRRYGRMTGQLLPNPSNVRVADDPRVKVHLIRAMLRALGGVWNFRVLLETLMGAIRNMNWTRLVPAFIVADYLKPILRSARFVY